MYYDKFHIILTLLVLLLPTGFTITYLIAVFNEHVEAGFPYISDTGAIPPESCIFGQVLTFGAILFLIIIYVRYHHVKLIISSNDQLTNSKITIFNKIAFVLGLFVAFGVTLVGNFQEQNVIQVHMIGAMLSFGLIVVYCLIHTFIARQLSHVLCSSPLMFCCRIFLGVISIIFFVTTLVFSSVAYASYEGKNPRKWMPDDGGFVYHVLSTSSEWLMAGTEMIFILTFFEDFRRVKIAYPTVHDHSLIQSIENREKY